MKFQVVTQLTIYQTLMIMSNNSSIYWTGIEPVSSVLGNFDRILKTTKLSLRWYFSGFLVFYQKYLTLRTRVRFPSSECWNYLILSSGLLVAVAKITSYTYDKTWAQGLSKQAPTGEETTGGAVHSMINSIDWSSVVGTFARILENH